jgi:hypothetical protein
MPHPADIDRREYLRLELFRIHEEIDSMLEAGSYQAAMAGRRIALKLRQELDDLEASSESDFDPTDPEQIVDEILKLPDEILGNPRLRARVLAACQLG